MKALAIDCCVSKFTVAAKNDDLFAKLTLDLGLRASEKIVSVMDFVLKEVSLAPGELEYTTLTKGPGGFTSLRIAMSALKALTLSNSIPIYAVSSLDAFAYPCKASFDKVLSVIESKENGVNSEYFYCFYDGGKKRGAEDAAEVGKIIIEAGGAPQILVCGPHAKSFCEKAESLKPSINPALNFFSFAVPDDACGALFEIAESMRGAAEKSGRVSGAPLKDYEGPLYVKKSEAQLALEAKRAAEKGARK